MIKVKHIILGLFIAFSSLAFAQDKLTLSDAISLGLENNYDLKVTRNSETISSINNTWGNTTLMPSVDFTFNANETFNFDDPENSRTQNLIPQVSLSWMVFNGFSARINKERYEELERQSQGNTAILVENSIQDIILAYNNCLLQKQLMEVYEDLTKLSEDRYTRSDDSRALGVSTTYENLQAKTSWLEDQSNYLQQKVNYENAVRTLNFILAADNDATWTFDTELNVDSKDYILEDLTQKLSANNTTLKNQYLYQSLLAKETELAKSAYMPTLNMSASVNNSDLYKNYSGSTATVNSNSSNAYVGLTLSWNIFSGGTRKRGVEIAKINEETGAVSTDQMVHSLSNQLLQTYSNYNVQKAILSLVNEQKAAAKLNLELSSDKFKNGSINSFNYRDVQIAYMNAAIAQTQAMYNLIQSDTELVRITGGIVDEYE